MEIDELILKENINKLQNIYRVIMYSKSDEEQLSSISFNMINDIKNILNTIFDKIICTDVIFTLNIDKPYFGIYINPIITSTCAITIIGTDEQVTIDNYQLELDSKLFDLNLEADEFVALILHEISSIVDCPSNIDTVRELIDLNILKNDKVINLRNSINYNQLIIFALKDVLNKVSSIIYKDNIEDGISNMAIQNLEMEEPLILAQQKIFNSYYNISNSINDPKISILKWAFSVYDDIKDNYYSITDTLKDSKDFTASKLLKKEIDKTISSINKISTNTLSESFNGNNDLNSFLRKKGLFSLNEGFFKNLKLGGLRSIEDALYEYQMRIKNCETEEDAMFILRGINSRLGILQDYIDNNNISSSERSRWEDVILQYRILREELIKRNIGSKKQYNIWIDYNALDNIDKN